MADVFLVSAREDHGLAQGIADSLERSGLSVARGDERMEGAAPCVLVLWSPVSVRSPVVREIATRAQQAGSLVTATLGDCEAPLGFARPAPFDLSNWRGDPDDAHLDHLFFAVDRMVVASRLGERRPAPSTISPAAPPADISKYKPIGRRAAPPAEPPPPPQAPHQPAPAGVAEQTFAWKQIEHSDDPADFDAHMRTYGENGLFYELARLKLDKLTTAPAPRPPPFLPPEAADPSHFGLRRAGPAPDIEPVAEPPPEKDWSEQVHEWRDPPQEMRQQRREDSEYLSATARAQRSSTNRPRRRVPLDEAHFTDEHARAPREGGSIPWRPLFFIALLGLGGYAMFGADLPIASGGGLKLPDPRNLAGVTRAAPLETPSPPPAAAAARAGPLVSAAASTVPAPAEAAPPVITFQPPAADASTDYVAPAWTRQPTPEQIAAAWPPEARATSVAGTAALDCAILPAGTLECRIVNATPENYGFGAAALAVANFYAAPTEFAGKRARLTIRFGSNN